MNPCSVHFSKSDPPLYYERWGSSSEGRPPLVMVHGGAHTGTCFLITPDGRQGWAPRAVAQGYEVVLPDWPGSGRSGWVDPRALTGSVVVEGLSGVLRELEEPVILVTHSMSGPYGWKLLETVGERIAAVVAVAPGMPGNIQPVPAVLQREADWIEIQAPTRRRRISIEEPTLPDMETVLLKFAGNGNRFPLAFAEAYCRTLQPIAPRLVWERQNVEASQLKVDDTTHYRGKPMLVMTGANDRDHPRNLDGAIVDWLLSVGANAEFDFLPEHGILGNGHMMMLEDNSDQIIDRILEWVARLL